MIFTYFRAKNCVSARRNLRQLASIACIAILMGQVACTENPSVVRYQAPKSAKPEQAALAAPSGEASSLVWQAPGDWVEGKASSMRLASYAIPVESGEAGDVSIVKLSGAAGGLLANVNRWAGQIGLANLSPEGLVEVLQDRTTKYDVDYKLVTLINKETQRAILAGIYDIGGDTVFAKLTISEDGLESSRLGFYSFCDSVGAAQ